MSKNTTPDMAKPQKRQVTKEPLGIKLRELSQRPKLPKMDLSEALNQIKSYLEDYLTLILNHELLITVAENKFKKTAWKKNFSGEFMESKDTTDLESQQEELGEMAKKLPIYKKIARFCKKNQLDFELWIDFDHEYFSAIISWE